jgi:hypothetical protein
MGLCCSTPVIAKSVETPSVVTSDPVILEQNPMIPDEITIVHVVAPTVETLAVETLAVEAPPVEETTVEPPNILDVAPIQTVVEITESRRSSKLPCQIELYKEAIGVIEKHIHEISKATAI